jgi:hypothetical protein
MTTIMLRRIEHRGVSLEELARAHGVTDIAVGRSEQPWYKHLLDSREPSS